MKNYTIVKVGSDYVVQAEEQSVLKVASRRRAAKLVVEATGLLDHPAVDAATRETADPSSEPSSVAGDPSGGSCEGS